MTATDLLHVLREARNSPVFIKGNFARTHAVDVAMAASLGFITTQVEWGEFSNRWHLTRKGMECLNAEAKSRSASQTTRRDRRKN